MAVKLDEMPKATRNGAGREEKYPYDDWFTGEPVFIGENTDFEVSPKGLAVTVQTFRAAAKRRGLALNVIRVVDSPNGSGLAIQAKPYVKGKPRGKKTAKKEAVAA